jgi:hypothetical protein
MQVYKKSFNEGHKLHVLEDKFHFIEILILHATKHVIQCVKKNWENKCNWNYDNYNWEYNTLIVKKSKIHANYNFVG